jgi:hypothetical protein
MLVAAAVKDNIRNPLKNAVVFALRAAAVPAVPPAVEAGP